MNRLHHLILVALFAFVSTQAISQCPPNLDFEHGDFSGWEYSAGSVTTFGGVNQINLAPTTPLPGRHELITAATAGMDPFGNFPTLCPYGGNYSFKLGNQNSGAEAEGLSYTFIVPSAVDTFTFTFFYAVVFQDPQHTLPEQPRFFATAYDVLTGNLINCASYDFVSTSGIPGFQISSVQSDVLYKNWSPVSIQFAGLANRQVRLEFKTADCTLGGHFGYAYVDVGTECANILATAPYCVETNSVILNAPFGFANYTWYNNDYSVTLGNGQSLTLSPPPSLSEKFNVDMEPYPGFGCRDTTYAIVHPEPVPDTPVANSTFNYCQFGFPPALTAQAEPGYMLLWYTAPTGGIGNNVAPVPSTTTAGTFTYYVSQKKLFGCESKRKEIKVVITPTPISNFTINSLRQCEIGNQFVFTNISTNLQNSQYTWDFGDSPTTVNTTDASHTYTTSGSFLVKLKVLNPPVCSTEKIVQVRVIPKPTAAFSFPPIICEKQTMVNFNDNSSVPLGVSTINGWWWNIDGTIQNGQSPAPFMFSNPGERKVKLVVTTQEGCISDTASKTLTVHYQPVAKFSFSPLCENQYVQFNNLSSMPAGSSPETIARWDWRFDNGNSSASLNPSQAFIAGVHHAKLIAESNFGCKSVDADSIITVNAKPEVAINVNDSCVFVPIYHTAVDLTSSVSKWYWNFGNGFSQGGSQVTKTYSATGSYSYTLIGQTIHGCTDTLFRPFSIFDNKSFAGRDTMTAMTQPVQLNANGGPNIQYTWTPSIGLNNPNIENPVALYDRDQRYHLYSISDKGCVKESDILIKRYKGPALYMPTAFTPNRDGKNDVFKVFPVGIKSFISLAVYNRHGQMLFYTTDYNKGWDGTFRGIQQASDNFVVIAKAIDYLGKPMMEKGNLILIR